MRQFEHALMNRWNRRVRYLALAAVVVPAIAMAERFSDWSEPVNLGPAVNSPALEGGAFLTRDELSLYVSSNRPDSLGGNDLYVTQRDSREDPWGPLQNLGPTVNTPGNDVTPTVSVDGHQLYFASDGHGGSGGLDLLVSYRRNKRDDFGWRAPVNLGEPVNSTANENGPTLYVADDRRKTVTLFFSSERFGGFDIFSSTQQRDGGFGAPTFLPELSTPSVDQRPSIRRDGLELFFDSDRPGGLGALDIWVARRRRTSDEWGAPENLGPRINTPLNDGRASLSFDQRSLYFNSVRPDGFGNPDIYVSTRHTLRGRGGN